MSRKNKTPRWTALPGGTYEFCAAIDYSRYVDRVTELIKLHERSHVWYILDLADSEFLLLLEGLAEPVPPIKLVQWAINDEILRDSPPKGKYLKAMLRDLREAFEAEKQERTGRFTWVHFLDIYWSMIPKITVTYGKNQAKFLIPVNHISAWDLGDVVEAIVEALPSGRNGKLSVSYNWTSGPPVGDPAFVTFDVTGNPEKKAFASALREAMRRCPTPEQAPEMIRAIPEQRAYLVHQRDKSFHSDLERYTRWLHGLSYRQIAYIESREQQGESLDLSKVPPTIGGEDIPQEIGTPIQGDSAVRKSVTQVYEAVYLAPFDEARLRRAQLVRDLPGYDCPDHGRQCPPARWDKSLKEVVICPYYRRWANRAVPDLPTDTTGKLPGEVPLRH